MSTPHPDRNADGTFARDDSKLRNGLLELIDIVRDIPTVSYSVPHVDRLAKLRAFVATIDEAPGEREKESEDEAL